ncbi:MAG: glycoside hydrolase family 2 [Actinomycetota bacterium]|nr:glycoside hydrolase family 2 [Actinomycetota bacterium]
MTPELLALHPRPQLARPRWTDLSGTWQFAYDDQDVGLDSRWHERTDVFHATIQVPYPPESAASGVGDPGYHPVVWYRRVVEVPELDSGERLLLHFGAVDYRARVWANGALVASHEGGHTPFTADVTAVLEPGHPLVITVRAEDPPWDMSQPRGKQDWQETPHNVWYDRTTGIWQPVWLEPVPAQRVARITWNSDLDRALLHARIAIDGLPLAPSPPDGLRVRVRLHLHGQLLADDTYSVTGAVVARAIPLDPAQIAHHRRTYLWSPRYPNLVDATVTLLAGDVVVDEVTSYVGLRSVAVSGGRFVLNGRPYFLRMVLAQNYWPDTNLTAPSAEALRREVEWIKELGFNGARIHQKIEDPRFLYWCDRLGVITWGELPSALDFTPEALRRLASEWLEVLERDASAPSLVAWVPFNESWGLPTLQNDPAQQQAVHALYSLTKAVDPTRLVIGNDGWQHVVSDLFTVHDYASSGETLRERYGTHAAVEHTLHKVQPYYRSIVLPGLEPDEEPLMITEFGGMTYDPESQEFWNGYGAVGSAEELLEKYAELVSGLLASPVVAGFCYTQLTDIAQERNGLLTQDRKPKVDPAAIRAINRGPSAAVPGDAIAEIDLVHQERLEADRGASPATPPGEERLA